MFTPVQTPIQGAVQWANAYVDIASNAKSCQGVTAVPAGIIAAKAILIPSLTAAFASSNPISTASGISLAFTEFWITPPQVFIGATPGLVTLVTSTALFQTGLLSLWATNTINHVDANWAYNQHINLFKLFTTGVVVAHSAPSVCVSPLIVS